jgi:hypothetical protein
MPDQYLQILWTLWTNNIIEPATVIKALEIYGYSLSYIGNSGLKTFKENETFEFIYGNEI